MKKACFRAVIAAALCGLHLSAQEKIADLGACKLESGETIRDCRIGYRTFGQLNAARSNAIVFPTWFTGTAAQLASNFGPGKLVDSSRYFVIAVDALGDGVSSSPSNSPDQNGMRFPRFNIRDMVETEYRLATETLHLMHLRAVIGISMGGMQTFQWAVSHPDFMDLAIPIVGSPQMTSYDLLLWTSELRIIQEDRDWANGDYQTNPPLHALANVHDLALTTPSYRAAQTSHAAFLAYVGGVEKNGVSHFDANNWYRQLQAMIADDVAAPFGGSMDKAAARVKAKMLVIVSLQDHMVNPQPAIAFAKLTHAPVVELTGPCGHLAPGCEAEKVRDPVSRFLDQP